MSNNQTTVVDLVGQIPSDSDHPLAEADSAFLPSILPNEGGRRGDEGEGFVFLVGPTDGHLFFSWAEKTRLRRAMQCWR